MPYEIKGKCVYKKTGKKVGCSDNPEQYLKALYANTNESIEEIVEKLQYAIEQHPSMLKVIPEEELHAYESANKKREWSLND